MLLKSTLYGLVFSDDLFLAPINSDIQLIYLIYWLSYFRDLYFLCTAVVGFE